jgi:hypothetical protein
MAIFQETRTKQEVGVADLTRIADGATKVTLSTAAATVPANAARDDIEPITPATMNITQFPQHSG